MAFAQRLGAIPETLAQPNFGSYVAGNSISLIGTWMQRIGIGWLAWQLSESGAVLGLVAFADLCPSLVIGPIGGALADRVDRRRMLIATQSLIMTLAFLLFAATWSGIVTVPLLIGLVTLNGLLVGFNQPARLALIPSLVARAQLPTAVAINSLVFNLARFLGPAIAGPVIAWGGVEWVFLLNSLSFVWFLVTLARLDLPPAAPRLGPRQSVLRDVADGLRYTARHGGIGPLLALQAVLAVAARPFVELLPGFAAEVFGQGALGLAVLSSAIGIGAIVSGLWLAQRSEQGDLPRLALLASLLLPLAVAAFAASPSFPLAVLSVAIAGAALVIGGVTAQTLIQTAVDEAIRGRVLSLHGLIFRGGPALGALAMGAASELWGLRLPVLLGALLGGLIALAIWRRRDAISASLLPPVSAAPPAARSAADR